MKNQYPPNAVGLTSWRNCIGHILRTKGCLFFLCVQGRSLLSFNMQKTYMRSGDLLVLTSDMFMSVESVSNNFSVLYVSLSDIILEMSYFKMSDMSLWNRLLFSPILRLNTKQYTLMSGWISQVEWILENILNPNRDLMLGYMVYNLFCAIDSEFSKTDYNGESDYNSCARTIFNKFWTLLMKNSPNKKDVKFYADALNITPDYLYKVCQRIYGISPKALIDQQLAIEIKTLLIDTELSIKEVANQLCFEDASYMCRFFRRITGQSPMQFRMNTKAISEIREQ